MKDSKGKKKIAIINSVCGVGSTGRICVELADFLEKNGLETLICYGRKDGNCKKSNSYCFSTKLDIVLHGLYARLFDKSGFGSKLATRRLIKKLELFNPSLIILNNLHGYYLNINIFLKWLADKNIKTLAILHDCWNFTGHCAHFEFFECEKWKTGCHNCPAKKEYPKSFLCDNSKNNYLLKKKLFNHISSLAIVCPSLWLANLVHKSFFSHRRIEVINNGIDISAFRHIMCDFKFKLGLLDKKIILCVASYFDHKKGIFDIYKLSEILDSNFILIIIGTIKIKKKISNNIIYIDRTNNVNELVNIYSSADVVFNPTYEDTFPTVNLEALSCHTPVICYRTGGATEMIDSRFVVDQGDYKKAYALMKELFDGKIEYPFDSSKDFSKEKMHKEYLKLINDILGQNKV